MNTAIQFENIDLKLEKIQRYLMSNGISGLTQAHEICKSHGLDIFKIIKRIQPISFDDAC